MPWTLGRKVFAAVFLVAVTVFGVVVLLAFNSDRQSKAAREGFAGVYENRDGSRIVLEADGSYDLGAYEMEGIAGEWELREYRTIPIGAFEPRELFIPYSQEIGGGGQSGWTYLIGRNGMTLTLEHDGVPSDDPLDRYVRTEDP